MASFVLVDLRSQLHYLPAAMRSWTRQQVLQWLQHYGEVRHSTNFPDTYFFRSWCGLETPFTLTEDNHLSIPGILVEAW